MFIKLYCFVVCVLYLVILIHYINITSLTSPFIFMFVYIFMSQLPQQTRSQRPPTSPFIFMFVYIFMSQPPQQTRSQRPPRLASSQSLLSKSAPATPNNQPPTPGNNLTTSKDNVTTPGNNSTTSGNSATTQTSENNHPSEANDISDPPTETTYGNDGDGSTSDQPDINNPTINTAIPINLTKEGVHKMLFEYNKYHTKITKCIHHQEFLETCRAGHKMPKGLQLKFTLNAVNQDRGLEARIQGILMQAKIEILEDIINHYKELSRNILQKLI